MPKTRVSPNYFKIEFNHDRYDSKIVVPVSFGSGSKHLFQLDNHSPSWINDRIIGEENSIKKTNNTFYETSVADGRKIEGDVFYCDTLAIGKVKFNNVILYNINDTTGYTDGVIGENVMSQGVWLIDFEYNKVIFASSIDSLDHRYFLEMSTLPTFFENGDFIIELVFSGGIKKRFGLDLGFNAEAILPYTDFKQIENAVTSHGTEVRFSTPGYNDQVVKNYTSQTKARLGVDSINIICHSNEKVAESLVGLPFFWHYDFVILDYPAKKIYVSRAR